MANKLYSLPPFILQRISYLPVRIIFGFFLRFEVIGLENLKGGNPPFIFAVNHSSELDPIFVAAALPFWKWKLLPLFYTSREQSFYKNSGWRQMIYGGTLFKIWGAYPVKVGINNYEESLKPHKKLLDDGYSLCIFPEGRKTTDGVIGEGKSGVSFLSFETKSQIIPVDISGGWRVSTADFLLRRRKVIVHFGKPIAIEDLFGIKTEADDHLRLELFPKATALVMSNIKEMHRLHSTI